LSDSNSHFRRQERVYQYLEEQDIDVAVLEDTEWRRNASLQYLSGMPGDSLLFFFRRGHSLLLPWDAIMAEKLASADQIIPYTEFNRKFDTALTSMVKKEGLEKGTIELLPATPHPLYAALKELLPENRLLCREEGIHRFLLSLREIKDEGELDIYTELGRITNILIDDLEERLRSGKLSTETDIALFLEKRSREEGCDGLGFETIAAGPERSFGIHAYPSYTEAPVTGPGFTIVDFGVKKEGYTSDVTLTAARAPLEEKQEEMMNLVEEAFTLAADSIKPGVSAAFPADEVARYFSAKGYTMPHALGHGIGLDAHESPVLRAGETEAPDLKAGMIITLEPGLYEVHAGGVRLEDDFLVTPEGCRKLTSSRILQIPDKK
jgi:Xaa-Pro dipeptidase